MPISSNAALEESIAEIVRKFNQSPEPSASASNFGTAASHSEAAASIHGASTSNYGATASNYGGSSSYGATASNYGATSSNYEEALSTSTSMTSNSSNIPKPIDNDLNDTDDRTAHFSAVLGSEPLGQRAGTSLDRELEKLVQDVSDKVDEVLQEFCDKDAHLKEAVEGTADVDVSFCVNLRAKDLLAGGGDMRSQERRTSTFLTELEDSEDETEDKEDEVSQVLKGRSNN